LFELEVFKVFVMVLVRFAGLFVTAPVLGSANFPVLAKVGLAGLTAIVVTPLLPPLPQTLPNEAIPFALIGATEFLIGVMIGFIMTLVFAAVQLGGQIMDIQTGFGILNVFNPALETQFPVFGFLLFILGLLYFVLVRGHFVLIYILADSFESVPIGEFAFRPQLFLEAARWGRDMFYYGVLIAAPIAAAMLLAYATLGLIGRVVPQIQLFVVGFPLTIGLGLILVGLMLGAYLNLLDRMFEQGYGHLETMIAGFRPAASS